MAIVLMLMSLLILSSLAAAMVTSGRTEVLISRNQERAAQARAAAEAGLNHGLEVTIAYVRNWQASGFADASAAISDLLNGPDNLAGTTATDADNGSLEALDIPRPPTRVTLSAGTGTTYEVRVFDEDDPARGTTLSTADVIRIEENSNASVDANRRIVVRAIGYAAGSTTATLEATVGPLILPAVITNSDLTISGNPTITGTNGSVHTNEDLTISGSPSISDDCTASGTYSDTPGTTCGGYEGGGRPTIGVPPVRAIDYVGLADFILHDDGRMTDENNGGALVCDASADTDACKNLGYGWKYLGSGNWTIDGDTAFNGSYYVEGNATISGNPGEPGNLLAISIIAKGDIDISGNPDLRPDLPELLFVTDKDLKVGGNFGQPTNIEGQILVHEQFMISGNPTLAGQIIVENAATVSTLVESNIIEGNPTIVYNGLVGSNTFNVSAWREVR